MIGRLLRACARAARGIGVAIRARPRAFVAVAAGVFGLNILLPLLVLSLARKPWDYFTFNPWIKKLPEYLVSSNVSLERKLEFLPNLALFWFLADGPYGPEWGFAVTVSDLLRFVLMAFLFGAYFALWFYRRDQLAQVGRGARTARHGGTFGALVSTLGLSTGPCTVTGCGAPVMPVLGLAFVGLSSGTLSFLADLSKVATTVVLLGVALGVLYLGWLAGASVEGSRLEPDRVHRSPRLKEGTS